MNISNVLNLLLALALVLLSVKMVRTEPQQTNHTDMDNSQVVMENLLTRVSVRSYTDQPVEEKHVREILKAGMAAPTAGNKQPWKFIVVNDPVILRELGDVLPYAKMTASAPVAIVACGDLNNVFDGEGREYWVQDLSAATENMLLAAHAMGLGAVWTGVYPVSDRVETVQRVLNLPREIVPLNVIPVGHPKESMPPKDKWKDEHIRYNQW